VCMGLRVVECGERGRYLLVLCQIVVSSFLCSFSFFPLVGLVHLRLLRILNDALLGIGRGILMTID
jgi:hypothetical protein